jgi:hypothetical protein
MTMKWFAMCLQTGAKYAAESAEAAAEIAAALKITTGAYWCVVQAMEA